MPAISSVANGMTGCRSLRVPRKTSRKTRGVSGEGAALAISMYQSANWFQAKP
jgi:hypothetical protein